MNKLLLVQSDSPTFFDAEELLKVVEVRLALKSNVATPPSASDKHKLPRAPPSMLASTNGSPSATQSILLLPDDRCIKAARAATAARPGRSKVTIVESMIADRDSPSEIPGSPTLDSSEGVFSGGRYAVTLPESSSSPSPSSRRGASLRQRRGGVQLSIDVELAEQRAKIRRAPSLPFDVDNETDLSTVTTRESEMVEARPPPCLVRCEVVKKKLTTPITPGIVVLSPLSTGRQRNAKLVISPCSYEGADTNDEEEEVLQEAGSLDWRRSTARLKDPPRMTRQPRLRVFGSSISLRSCFGETAASSTPNTERPKRSHHPSRDPASAAVHHHFPSPQSQGPKLEGRMRRIASLEHLRGMMDPFRAR